MLITAEDSRCKESYLSPPVLLEHPCPFQKLSWGTSAIVVCYIGEWQAVSFRPDLWCISVKWEDLGDYRTGFTFQDDYA